MWLLCRLHPAAKYDYCNYDNFLFIIFISDLCDGIKHSKCLLFADDLKVYRAISSSSHCLLPQSDIDPVHNWCMENRMKAKFGKVRVISFARKTNILNDQYRLANSFILRTDSIKDLGGHIYCKLHFRRHADFHFSHALKLLGIIRETTFFFPTTNSLLVLYFALFRSKLEYASVAWNFATITDSNKLERAQIKFVALWQNRFF
jgi:hypothetical protein